MWKLFLAGCATPLAFAPWNFFPFAMLGLYVLFAAWHTGTARDAFRRGWVFGAGFFGVGVSWIFISIYTFGGTNIVLAGVITLFCVAFLALFHGMQGYLLKKLYPQPNASFLLIGGPCSMLLLEFFRSWVFTGFPWLFFGYSQFNTPLLGFAPIIGVYGVSLLLGVGVGLIMLLVKPAAYGQLATKHGRIAASLGLILIYGAGYCCQQINWTDSRQQRSSVCLIQGNIMPNDKFLLSQPLQTVSEVYLQPTKQNLQHNFIIWPENSIPVPLPYAEPFIALLQQLALENNTTLLVGLPVEVSKEPAAYYNSLLALGAGTGVYHKQHLVPFGEYLPLDKLLRGLINFFALPMSSFIKGPTRQAALTTPHSKLLPFICYEIAYPEQVRQALLTTPSDAIVTISEDGWFGDSWGPHQHLAIARMRAIENGRYVIRATTSGISAIIDSKGRVLKQSPQLQPYVLRGEFVNYSGLTPWTRHGQAPILLGCVLLLMLTSIQQLKLIVGRSLMAIITCCAASIRAITTF